MSTAVVRFFGFPTAGNRVEQSYLANFHGQHLARSCRTALVKDSLNCKNALYMDGGISQAYYPDRGVTQSHGFFGPMIGVTDTRR